MTMSDPYCLRHRRQRATVDADQAEFDAFIKGSTVVDAGVYDDRVAGALDDYTPVEDSSITADWQLQDLETEAAVGSVHEELYRRQELMGETYPFELDGGQLNYNPDKSNIVYEFCLAICNSPPITAEPYNELPKNFERLTADLIKAYFGCLSEALHTGWPRDKNVGIRFREAMESLDSAAGEWAWSPEDDLPRDPLPCYTKDEGVDFIVWKRSPDNRLWGQLFVLGQCACGNNWDTKLDEPNLRTLSKWFRRLPLVKPIKVFLTPHHIVDAKLKETTRDYGGTVFDRSRLALIASQVENLDVLNQWSDALEGLINLVKEAA